MICLDSERIDIMMLSYVDLYFKVLFNSKLYIRTGLKQKSVIVVTC